MRRPSTGLQRGSPSEGVVRLQREGVGHAGDVVDDMQEARVLIVRPDRRVEYIADFASR